MRQQARIKMLSFSSFQVKVWGNPWQDRKLVLHEVLIWAEWVSEEYLNFLVLVEIQYDQYG